MFSYLQIYEPRERRLVAAADFLLAAGRLALAPLPRRRLSDQPRRILLLRLERIGDLMMTLDALEATREKAPDAEIDLVVGSWNASVARHLPWIDRVEVLDAPWLTRDGTPAGYRDLIGAADVWRGRHYDLAINFEGDIRTNILMGLTRAPRRIGFGMAGGRAALTDTVQFDPRLHTSENSLRLIRRAFGAEEGSLDAPVRTGPPPVFPRFAPPGEASARAVELLSNGSGNRPGPHRATFVGVHPSGGREIKQWDLARLAEVGRQLSQSHGVTLVITGDRSDLALAEGLKTIWSDLPVIDLTGKISAIDLAAVLQRLDLFISADTGPMHLAAAMGTPVLAIFGPSDPARYAPRGVASRVIRVDLPCSPCNRIRLPPARCAGHLPDCLRGIEVNMVYDAAVSLLDTKKGLASG